jgi:hypothetical protein
MVGPSQAMGRKSGSAIDEFVFRFTGRWTRHAAFFLAVTAANQASPIYVGRLTGGIGISLSSGTTA